MSVVKTVDNRQLSGILSSRNTYVCARARVYLYIYIYIYVYMLQTKYEMVVLLKCL
jgi:hypothetical protein